ncbi:hypothetical protein RJT34_12714 [Clitoria ternatea]|uniref:Uncharacterized protein n=1 Tax=Clitoria ternatea TaxID=43366 RepID=A0AAN9JMP7_CLITE
MFTPDSPRYKTLQIAFGPRGLRVPGAEGFVVGGGDKEAGVKDALVVVVVLLHRGEGEVVGTKIRVGEVVGVEGLIDGGGGKETTRFGRGRRRRCQSCSRGH